MDIVLCKNNKQFIIGHKEKDQGHNFTLEQSSFAPLLDEFVK